MTFYHHEYPKFLLLLFVDLLRRERVEWECDDQFYDSVRFVSFANCLDFPLQIPSCLCIRNRIPRISFLTFLFWEVNMKRYDFCKASLQKSAGDENMNFLLQTLDVFSLFEVDRVRPEWFNLLKTAGRSVRPWRLSHLTIVREGFYWRRILKREQQLKELCVLLSWYQFLEEISSTDSQRKRFVVGNTGEDLRSTSQNKDMTVSKRE